MKAFRSALFALFASVALYACGSSGSQASSGAGLTQSQVQALISQAVTPLQQQIATLQQSSAPAVFIKAPNAPAISIKAQSRGTSQKAAASTCTGLGTLTGRPSDSDPMATDLIAGVSCTGYYFTVSVAATSAQSAQVQPAPNNIPVYYDAPNCTGNAYIVVGGRGVSQGALANGAVFTTANTFDGNPGYVVSYWMLEPSAASSQPTLLSSSSGDAVNGDPTQINQTCTNATTTGMTVYALAPNDPTVSGVPSAPVQGPVTIG